MQSNFVKIMGLNMLSKREDSDEPSKNGEDGTPHADGLLKEKGYISPVALLVGMDRLTPKQMADWRRKKIPYLERVTVDGLGKMNFILKTLNKFAKAYELKPLKTVYKSWGKEP